MCFVPADPHSLESPQSPVSGGQSPVGSPRTSLLRSSMRKSSAGLPMSVLHRDSAGKAVLHGGNPGLDYAASDASSVVEMPDGEDEEYSPLPRPQGLTLHLLRQVSI